MDKAGYVYIMMNKNNTTSYVGVTSDLVKRVGQHKEKLIDGFSKKYNLTKLVYYEECDGIEAAIQREKYLKGKKRAYKMELVTRQNKEYRDLYGDVLK